MKKFLKVLSAFLALVLLVNIVPAGAIDIDFSTSLTTSSRAQTRRWLRALKPIPPGPNAAQPMTADQIAAAGRGETINEKIDPSPITGEDKTLRSDPFTRHFRHVNSLYTAALFPNPVQFLNDRGAWQDIDNTLREERDAAGNAYFTPTASGLDLRIPKWFTGEQELTMGKDGYMVGLRMIDTFSQREAQPPADEDADTVVEEETQPTTEPETTTEAETTTEPEATTEAATEPETTAEAETTTAVEDTQPEGEALVEMTLPANANPLEDTARELEVAEPAVKAFSAEGQIRQIKEEKEEPAPAKTRAERIARDNAEFMEAKNLNSAVFFEDMAPGTDIEYRVGPNSVSEYKIVKTLQREYIYHYLLTHDGLTPVQQEDGSISFFKENDAVKPLFVLESPYMFDAAGEYSTAVTMTLHEGGLLVLTADAAWVNAPERVLPVTIDPTLVENSVTNMQDTWVGSLFGFDHINHHGESHTFVGNAYVTGKRRTYISFDLPSLPSGSVVTYAQMSMYQDGSNIFNHGNYICVFPIPANEVWFPNQVTWFNQPMAKDNLLGNYYCADFQEYGRYSTWHTFDITKTVKNWYEDGSNNGLMLAAYDESEISEASLVSANNSNSQPSVAIVYNTNVGLESYWPYENVDLGRSGSVFVNSYNGNMTYVHNDISMTGNRLPINISHMYNTNKDNNSGTYQNMNLGTGFRLNIMEQLEAIDPNDDLYQQNIRTDEFDNPILDSNGNVIDDCSFRYRLIDGDGTVHYFREIDAGNSETKIVHEFDSTQELDDTNTPWTITDAQNNKKYYNASHGYLEAIVDSNGNEQTITWTGGQITEVTDPAGRKVKFEYDQYDYLLYMEDPAERQTLFDYSGGQLASITYPGGKMTSFQYDGDNISCITAFDDSSVEISYYSPYNNSGRRVEQVTQLDEANNPIDFLLFSYFSENESGAAAGNTVVTNAYGKCNAYTFNTFGCMTSVTNQVGQAQFSEYYEATDDEKDRNSFNKIRNNSEFQTIANNLLTNHGFESNDAWDFLNFGVTAEYSNEASKNGLRSVKLANSTEFGISAAVQQFPVCNSGESYAGRTFTLSADAHIPEMLEGNGGAVIGVLWVNSYGNIDMNVSRVVKLTEGWERLGYTFKLPDDAVNEFMVGLVLLDAEGTVFFDNVQLEESGGARHYNLLENSNFFNALGATPNNSVPPIGWNVLGAKSYEGVYRVEGDNDAYVRNELRLLGEPDRDNKATQTVYLNAKEGQTLIFGGRAGAYAKNYPPEDENNRHSFAIIVDIYTDENDTGPVRVAADFDANIPMAHQMTASAHTLETDCYKVVFSFVYRNQTNGTALSEAFLYVGNYGESYTYDDDGQLIETRNDSDESTYYTYEDNKIVSIDQAHGSLQSNISTIEYDGNSSNISKIANHKGTEITFEYNDYGQVVSQTVTHLIPETEEEEEEEEEEKEPIVFTEEMTYIQDGNYLSEVTDARGGVTRYEYDEDRGLLISVEDPNGNITTYEYDEYTDELIEVIGPEGASTSFAFENYLPSEITRNGTTYSYEYDDQNRITSSKVGSQDIVNNTYDECQRLEQQIYGNGASYVPIYDDRDRLVGEEWDYAQTAEYFYNENNRLSNMIDHTTGIAYQYSYYFDGLVSKIAGSDAVLSDGFLENSSLTEFRYDVNGAIARLTHTQGNTILHDATYARNGNGSPIFATLYSLDGAGLDYEYDALGRLTQRRLSTSSASLINSITYLEGGTSNLVEKYTNEDAYWGVLQQYEYTYDDNGNITSVTDVKGNVTNYTYDGLNRLVGESGPYGTLIYEYDIGGNLLSVTDGSSVLNTYSYGDANWGDRLTSFDGKAITYDEIGNPTSYDGQTFTWQRGRQLTEISSVNGSNIEYTYDTMGRRTSKTVENVTTHYTYAGDLLIRQSDETDTLDFTYDAGGTAVGFTHNGTPYFYLRNLQGDVEAITDAEGKIVARYAYDAWGNALPVEPDCNCTNCNCLDCRFCDCEDCDCENCYHEKIFSCECTNCSCEDCRFCECEDCDCDYCCWKEPIPCDCINCACYDCRFCDCNDCDCAGCCAVPCDCSACNCPDCRFCDCNDCDCVDCCIVPCNCTSCNCADCRFCVCNDCDCPNCCIVPCNCTNCSCPDCRFCSCNDCDCVNCCAVPCNCSNCNCLDCRACECNDCDCSGCCPVPCDCSNCTCLDCRYCDCNDCDCEGCCEKAPIPCDCSNCNCLDCRLCECEDCDCKFCWCFVPDRTREEELVEQALLGLELDGQVIEVLLPLILSKNILNPRTIGEKFFKYAKLLELEVGEVNLIDIVTGMHMWPTIISDASLENEIDLWLIIADIVFTMTPTEILSYADDPQQLLDKYGLDFEWAWPEPPEEDAHWLAWLGYVLAIIAIVITVAPVVYFADVVSDLREDLTELDLGIDIDEVLEAIMVCYVVNLDEIIFAYCNFDPELELNTSSLLESSFFESLLGNRFGENMEQPGFFEKIGGFFTGIFSSNKTSQTAGSSSGSTQNKSAPTGNGNNKQNNSAPKTSNPKPGSTKPAAQSGDAQTKKPGFFEKVGNFFKKSGDGDNKQTTGAPQSSSTRGGEEFSIGELNPIRYRGYYYDNETGYYFLQTRYYNPEWRRFINADNSFIAGDDPLNAANMFAYCNGNPVMYADPSGMGIISKLYALRGDYALGLPDRWQKAINILTLGEPVARGIVNSVGAFIVGVAFEISAGLLAVVDLIASALSETERERKFIYEPFKAFAVGQNATRSISNKFFDGVIWIANAMIFLQDIIPDWAVLKHDWFYAWSDVARNISQTPAWIEFMRTLGYEVNEDLFNAVYEPELQALEDELENVLNGSPMFAPAYNSTSQTLAPYYVKEAQRRDFLYYNKNNVKPLVQAIIFYNGTSSTYTDEKTARLYLILRDEKNPFPNPTTYGVDWSIPLPGTRFNFKGNDVPSKPPVPPFSSYTYTFDSNLLAYGTVTAAEEFDVRIGATLTFKDQALTGIGASASVQVISVKKTDAQFTVKKGAIAQTGPTFARYAYTFPDTTQVDVLGEYGNWYFVSTGVYGLEGEKAYMFVQKKDEYVKDEDITISWGGSAIKSVVSEKSLNLIKECLREAGLKSCTITSTYRSFSEQARVMYNNIVSYGVDVQRGEYGKNGNLVIDVYVESKAAGKTPDQIKADMTKKIEDLYAEGEIVGGGHCVSAEDYAKANVLDIGCSSISNKTKFKAALRKAEADGKLFFNDEEKTNKCYHLKIYQ